MTRGYISIGSNIDKERHIAAGLRSIEAVFGPLVVSGVYESASVGFSGDAFYNQVVGFDSELDVRSVSRQLREIEFENGRLQESKKFSARTLDLDLILYGDLIINDGSLQLPRLDIERYAFVLEPLAEIAPTQIHPVLLVSYESLWHQMPKANLQQHRIQLNQN